MSETPPVDDTRFGMHRVFMDEPEGVAETVGDVPVCPTCLRAFQASKYGPAICEDCWQEDLQRVGGGGKRFVTEHGEKKHFSARCPHLRGSTYRMVSDEACVLGRRGPCGTCGTGGRDAKVLTDGGDDEPRFRWFWGSDLNEIEGYVRYDHGRRVFLDETDDDTVVVGVVLPEDISEETSEPTLKFHNIGYYEAPLFRGGGYVVTRLPPRDMMYQYYREARGRSDDHPSLRVDDEVTYS